MQLPDAAVGSVIAAVIAGLVVFISTVLAKEQKTSEFRQNWIDELRKDVSQYISGVSEVVALHLAKSASKEEQSKFLSENFQLIQELQALEHRIVLRLNPTEHSSLLNQVISLRPNMMAAYRQTDRAQIEEKLTKELLTSTQLVLKNEWTRVKKGEPAFRAIKWVALLAIAAVAAFFIFSLNTKTSVLTDVAKAGDGAKNQPINVSINNSPITSQCIVSDKASQQSSRVASHPIHKRSAPKTDRELQNTTQVESTSSEPKCP